MATPKIFESEYRFCLILWEHEPVKSSELAKLCKQRLDWSKTTTYTVIKRLSERGVLKNENTVVTSLISKEEAQLSELEELMDKKFWEKGDILRSKVVSCKTRMSHKAAFAITEGVEVGIL